MLEITVELPHVLIDHGKIRKRYTDSQGIHYKVCGFGSYPCDLNGGRNFKGGDDFDANHLSFRGGKTVARYISEGNDDWRGKTQDLIKARAKRLNAKGVPFFVTMTNLCPNGQDDMNEAFEYLDLLADSGSDNGVVLANRAYAKAVMKRYGSDGVNGRRSPNLRYVCSVIRHYDDPRTYAHLFKKYDDVVIKPEDVITSEGRVNDRFFREIGSDNISRSIVIVNHHCQRDCASAKDHYRKTSEMAKSFELHSGISGDRMVCNKSGVLMLDEGHVKQLIDIGVPKFKVGRTKDPTIPSKELFPAVKVFK